jgi:putative oxidoreductase
LSGLRRLFSRRLSVVHAKCESTRPKIALTGLSWEEYMTGTTGLIDRSRLIFPGLAGLYDSVAPYSYALIRFIAGAILVYHGYNKLFGGIINGVATNVVTPLGLPDPILWAYFLGILECFGGAALAIGFLTRPIALMLVVEFLIITYWHFGNGYGFSSPKGGYEYPLVLLVLYIAIFFRGAGRCSVDRMIGKEF